MPDQSSRQNHPIPGKKRRPNYKRRQRVLVGGLIGVSLISRSVGAWLTSFLSQTSFMQSQLRPEEADVFNQGGQLSEGTNLQIPQLSRATNVLVLGTKVLTSEVTDQSTPQEGYQALMNSLDGLADTMLLLRFDPDTQKLVVLSIPRDTRTEIEGHGITKINAANAYGKPALTAKTVSQLLGGVEIDRYIRINVQGVEKLIDALSGVTIYVPRDMYYRDDSQHFYVNLKAGEQHLDGNQALQFLRFRYGELGDIGRVRRQQMFFNAMLQQALSPSTLLRLPQLFSVIRDNLDTNLSNQELLALANFAVQVERSQVQMLMIPGRFSAPREYRASYWLPDQAQIQSLIAPYFDVEPGSLQAVEPSTLRVAIQPDANQTVVAESLITMLAKSGYQHIRVVEPFYRPLDHTRIIAQNGDRATAEAIREVLGLGKVRVESTGDFYSDITIQLGKDWLEQQRIR